MSLSGALGRRRSASSRVNAEDLALDLIAREVSL